MVDFYSEFVKYSEEREYVLFIDIGICKDEISLGLVFCWVVELGMWK